MYETKAFWGKEENSNINTINNTMNVINNYGLIPVVIIIVAAIFCVMGLTTRAGFS